MAHFLPRISRHRLVESTTFTIGFTTRLDDKVHDRVHDEGGADLRS